jgi:PhnB protein
MSSPRAGSLSGMTSILNPYLHFDGNARDVLGFYHSLFGGELRVMTFGEMGAEGDLADQVMHGQITTPDGLTLMVSDGGPGEPVERGNAWSLSLSGDDGAELRGWFEALADGGTVTVPLERQMWGDVYGQLVDRFGTPWMVNIAQPG